MINHVPQGDEWYEVAELFTHGGKSTVKFEEGYVGCLIDEEDGLSPNYYQLTDIIARRNNLDFNKLHNIVKNQTPKTLI